MGLFKNSAIKMDRRIYLVFAVVASIAVANAIISTLKIRDNKNRINEITQYSNPTLEGLEEFNLMVTRSRMFISNWVYLPNNSNDKNSLKQLNTILYPRLKVRLLSLTDGWHSNTHAGQVRMLFNEYESIIKEQQKIMNSLVKFSDYQDPMKRFLAEEQLESEIIPATNKIIKNLRELIVIKKDEAKTLQTAMVQDNAHLLLFVFTLAILVIAAIMIAGLYMMRKIILPLIRVRDVLLKMSAGELPELEIETEKSALSEMQTALFQLRDRLQRTSNFAREIGWSNFDANFRALSEKDVLGTALLEMRDKLKHASEEEALRAWTAEGFSRISNILHRHFEDVHQLADEILEEVTRYSEAHQGAMYMVNDTNGLDVYIEVISFSAPSRAMLEKKRIEIDEGLVGKVIASNKKMHLEHITDHSQGIETGMASIQVCDILILPLYAGGKVIGAIEIKSIQPLHSNRINFLERITEPVATNILNLKANLFTRALLEMSQEKTRELAEQDEELRMINSELMRQSERLKKSETELRRQQEALQRVNSELEQKALQLEEKNITIEDAHKALAFKADQLEKTSKYKSDFLANMSHELRTPLNSVLILARLLSENRNGNMTTKQVEHARVILKSGSDLLIIINDILDLSKIEAGKLELTRESTSIAEICDNMEKLFREVSREKMIAFSTSFEYQQSSMIHTDRVRLEQVLKNLLSNAFKFTPGEGEVKLEVIRNPGGVPYRNEKLRNADNVICFRVSDTGIGIPEDKQKFIFEAFNQADSSITRKYGGTGLGLAICNQLCALLGGDLILESTEGKGSVFSLYLPETTDNKSLAPLDISQKPVYRFITDRVLLYCPDDSDAATWNELLSVKNNRVTRWDGMRIETIPGNMSLVIIDATLPDKEFIERIRFFRNFENTRNARIICRSMSEFIPDEIRNEIELHTTGSLTPVLLAQFFSNPQGNAFHSALYDEAAGEIPGPVKKVTAMRLKGIRILIADDDIRNIYSMTTIFESEGASVICAMDGIEAIEKLKENPQTDIVLMDIMMPNKDGLQAIREIREMEEFKEIPLIAVTAKVMRGDREICIGAGATDYITKPFHTETLVNKIEQLTINL